MIPYSVFEPSGALAVAHEEVVSKIEELWSAPRPTWGTASVLSNFIFLKPLNSPVIQSTLLLYPPSLRQYAQGFSKEWLWSLDAAEGHQELWWESPRAVLFHSHPVLRSEAASGSLVAGLHSSPSHCHTPLAGTARRDSQLLLVCSGCWISTGLAGHGECCQEQEQPQDQAVTAVIGCSEPKAQTHLSSELSTGSWPQEHLPLADKWTLLELAMQLKSLRKGQALAAVAAASLTGTQVCCDPASSYHLFCFVRLGGLIWDFPELQHHRDPGCSSLTILLQEKPVYLKHGLNLTLQYFCFP